MRSYVLRVPVLELGPLGRFPHPLEEARKSVAAELDQLRAELAPINFSKALHRLRGLIGVNWEDEVATSPEVDALHATLHEYPSKLERANDCWFILQALEALAAEESATAVMERLADSPWAVKAEILARLSWIREQRDGLALGLTFTSPFRGTVSARGATGRTIDREHYQLIKYLHGLNMQLGQRLLVVRKGETPDFILLDEQGEQIGAEMGEAPVSQQWADEQDAAERVQSVLRPLVAREERSLGIEEPCAWRLWFERLDDLVATLEEAIAAAGTGERAGVVNDELGFRASLREGNGLIMIHDPRGQGAADLEEAADRMAEAIVTAVDKKLRRNGRQRKTPSVRPCDLVLYPNSDDWPDPERVHQLAAVSLSEDWRTHFDRIWLSSETYIGQLQ